MQVYARTVFVAEYETSSRLNILEVHISISILKKSKNPIRITAQYEHIRNIIEVRGNMKYVPGVHI